MAFSKGTISMKIKLINYGAAENNLLPIRAHYNDAGLDCFAMEDFALFEFGQSIKILRDNGVETKSVDRELVPLGFGLKIPDGYMATIRPRSSMNIKGIITQIGTIDSGYTGEIKAYFINTSKNIYHFKKGDKICQIVVEPIALVEPVLELEDNRGTGGFGSTGK